MVMMCNPQFRNVLAIMLVHCKMHFYMYMYEHVLMFLCDLCAYLRFLLLLIITKYYLLMYACAVITHLK